MKKWVQGLVLVALAGGLSGCQYAKKTELAALQIEHDTLQARHEFIVSQLSAWAQETYDWEDWTFQVICDVIAKNGPESKYAARTVQYCQDAEGGDPPPPPIWGRQ